jgi:hypothetical protein
MVPIWETRLLSTQKQAHRPENRPMRKGEISRRLEESGLPVF